MQLAQESRKEKGRTAKGSTGASIASVYRPPAKGPSPSKSPSPQRSAAPREGKENAGAGNREPRRRGMPPTLDGAARPPRETVPRRARSSSLTALSSRSPKKVRYTEEALCAASQELLLRSITIKNAHSSEVRQRANFSYVILSVHALSRLSLRCRSSRKCWTLRRRRSLNCSWRTSSALQSSSLGCWLFARISSSSTAAK